MFFSRFLKMVRIQLLGLSQGHSTRWEQLMKKSVKVMRRSLAERKLLDSRGHICLK